MSSAPARITKKARGVSRYPGDSLADFSELIPLLFSVATTRDHPDVRARALCELINDHILIRIFEFPTWLEFVTVLLQEHRNKCNVVFRYRLADVP